MATKQFCYELLQFSQINKFLSQNCGKEGGISGNLCNLWRKTSQSLFLIMQISAIYIYPVKSLAGISLTSAVVQTRGLQWDRRWMLTDMSGQFLTQREFPQLALLQPEIKENELIIHHKFDASLSVQIPIGVENTLLSVKIWNDITYGVISDDKTNTFFSDFLKSKCQLVYMPDSVDRQVDPAYDRGNNVVSYADGYPFLIIGEASLADLNARLEMPVPMNRFRPNFVLTGAEAFAEDDFYKIRIGSVEFDAVKKCARCNIPTNDQETGIMGKEPLRTLSTYRRAGNKVQFGMNLCMNNPAQVGALVRVGEEVNL